MSEKVLLVNPNRMKPPVAPIALDYLASALENRNFEVDVLDLCFSEDVNQDIDGYFTNNSPVAIGVSLRNTDDTTLSSGESFMPGFKEIIDRIKERTSAPVILGGSGFSIMPESVLEHMGLDLGIAGDGEDSLPLLVEKLISKQDYSPVPGLVYRSGDKFQRNPLACVDMRNYPTTTRTYIDNLRYFTEGGMAGVETKRGCDKNCIYCADPLIKGKRYRERPAKSAVDEIITLYDMGIKAFHLCDSEFNLPSIHAEEVCLEIVRRKLENKLKWYTYAHPSRFTADMAILFKKAGCIGINFGVDSVSDMMLKALGRDFKDEHIKNAAYFCHRIDLPFMFDLLLGGPGETKETLKETIELIKELSPSRVGAALGVRIFPGTALAKMLIAQGPLDRNPNLKGKVTGNDNFFEPVFYLSSELGDNPQQYLADLIGDDERFFFMGPRQDGDRNYNYNDNILLQDAIKAGYRGAFWDILRRYINDKKNGQLPRNHN